MDKIKRSYYLPEKLIKHFDEQMSKSGLVRERAVAAAIGKFLDASPNERQDMFNALDTFLNSRRRK